MSTLQSGLIDDDAVISAELKTLVETLRKLGEEIEADRATLRMVERVERLPNIVPADEKMVVAIYTPERGLVTSLSS
ncbi:MAG: hypothetical protein HY867_06285 [Chloroflexi bacterium]|nr:hypothetical protein [Chloroflexota bacterium]